MKKNIKFFNKIRLEETKQEINIFIDTLCVYRELLNGWEGGDEYNNFTPEDGEKIEGVFNIKLNIPSKGGESLWRLKKAAEAEKFYEERIILRRKEVMAVWPPIEEEIDWSFFSDLDD